MNRNKPNASKAPASGVAGAQAIRRAVDVLCAAAMSQGRGATLADLARTTGLHRSTAFRMAHALCEKGLLEHDDEARTYFVGPLAYEIGLAARDRSWMAADWRACLEEIRDGTGMTVYLGARSDLDVVCIACLEGVGLIRAVVYGVGERRPLGLGSGSVAMLAQLEDAEVERIITQNVPRFARLGFPPFSRESLWRSVNAVRRDGYICHRGAVIPGVIGIGVSLPSRSGMTKLGVTISIPAADISAEEEARLVAIMRGAIQRARDARR